MPTTAMARERRPKGGDKKREQICINVCNFSMLGKLKKKRRSGGQPLLGVHCRPQWTENSAVTHCHPQWTEDSAVTHCGQRTVQSCSCDARRLTVDGGRGTMPGRSLWTEDRARTSRRNVHCCLLLHWDHMRRLAKSAPQRGQCEFCTGYSTVHDVHTAQAWQIRQRRCRIARNMPPDALARHMREYKTK